MQKLYKKTAGLIISVFLLGILTAPVVFAQNCDEDGDGYIAIPESAIGIILPDNFNPNGNYSPAEWDYFFNIFKNDPGSIELCGPLAFKKGAEPTRCDAPIIDPNSGVYDPSKVQGMIMGNQVNPGVFDIPDNFIDENCDGKDATLITKTGTEQELGSLVDKIIVWLSRAVVIVSIIILIWGGMLYTTAAGDEQKTAKARKAIIGAIIGLIVGLLAPTIVNWVAVSLA